MNMRGVNPPPIPNAMADIREKQRETQAAERMQKSAQWKERAANRASSEAKRLANEAAELEAMLNAVTSGSTLPSIGSRIGGNALDQLKGKLGREGSARPRVVLDQGKGARSSGALHGSIVRSTPPVSSNPNPSL